MTLEKIEPNIYKKTLKDGTWTYYVKAKIAGRVVTRSCKSKSIRVARNTVRTLQERAAQGGAVVSRSGVTVASFYPEAQQYWKLRGIREVTRFDYEKRWKKHVSPRWGATPVQNVSTRAIQQWCDALREGQSFSSVKKHLQVLRVVLERAVRAGIINQNPCTGVEVVGQTTYQMTPLTPEQTKKLVSWVRRTRRQGEMRALQIDLLARQGLRRSEMCGLKIGDFFEQNGIYWMTISRSVTRQKKALSINAPKNHRSRTIAVWGDLAEALQKYMKGKSADAWLFPSATREDEPTDPAAFSQSLTRMLAAYRETGGDLPEDFSGAHDFRHTCASLLVAQNRNVFEVSRFLGHSDPSVTLRIYTHLFPAVTGAIVQ